MPSRGAPGGPGGRRGGSRGGRGSKPQRGSRSIPTEEEVLARNAGPSESSEQSDEQTEEELQQPRRGPAFVANSDGSRRGRRTGWGRLLDAGNRGVVARA
ncbi:uncharacterized protein LOC34622875 [Cyclospora cayetanensis]|uniref:Uncharacterized protein LOC34622875 n=1 Tax=Cyclospora cayetanensis TaxID=88456 RepID=A0A6P6RRJ2_9EIME|nr:uncharacterized protein LOC34622875 [Cyclospora cayetanensis]